MKQTDQQNVPKLRFPGFEGDWKETTLAPHLEQHQQRVPADTDIPVFSSSRSGLKSQKDYFAGDDLRNEGEYGVVPHGFFTYRHMSDDITFKFNLNTLGHPIAVSKEYPVFQTVNLESAFLLDWLNNSPHFSRFAAQHKLGGTRTRLYFKNLKTLRIHLPTLPEQRKIASFLGAVDTKIAQLAHKKSLLEDYKKGCMQQLFSQKIRFKDDDGTDFPDWEEKRLGEVFSWINTNSLSRERLTLDGGNVQNIHYGDIHKKFAANFHQDAEPVPYVKDVAPADFKPQQFCKVGDVVIADASEDYADIGKAIEIVSLGETPLVSGLHTYIARPKPAMVQTGFAGYLLRSAPMRRQIVRIAQGISVLGISKGNLEKLTFFLPHPEEQRKIADFLSALDRKIDLVGQELTHARAFKQGLLQQMFV